MTLKSKEDLDALLRSWPAIAPGKAKGVIEPEDNADWEARADVIVNAALAAGSGEASALEEPPLLPAVAGEPEFASGGVKMSQENEPSGTPTSGESSAPAAPSTPPPERKRSSLKALAEKAQAAPRSSVAPVSSVGGRAPASTPIPSAPIASARPSAPSAPMSRPKEAGADDSGVINLNVVHATATAQQIADAEKAKPASAGLFDDEKPAAAAAAAPAAEQKPATVVPITAAQPKKSNGPIVGAIIALVGVAAAIAIMKTQKPAQQPVATNDAKPVVTAVAPKPTAATAETAAPSAVAAATPEASATPSSEPDKAAGPGPKVAGGGATNSGGPAPAASVAAKDAPQDKVAEAPKPPTPTGKPGDLASEMARAVGSDGQPKEAAGGTPEPAAGNPKNQNIPEQPAQGSVTSAVGAVIGGAKACVAGADDVSRAQVTFSSNGSVSSVSVTGWAAANGKSGCVQAALKGAKVPPFSKSSYSVGIPIRP